ncbi:MAG: hypothetical protein IJZ52_04865 [Clostridium sp.]|nr:hypothetical protein [Clostridium sp.]
MKKLLLTTLLASLLILPLGTIALADDETAASENVQVVEYIPGSVPAQTDLSSMLPAMHAVLLAMDNQGVTSFAADNETLSWEMLYNMLSMYGQMDDRAYYDGEMLILPSETVMDYSAALFELPPAVETLPAELADRMTYDAGLDEYRLYCGSDALSQVVIDSTADSVGSVELAGRLVYLAEDETLCSFTASLAVCDNLFGYTLAELNVA